MKESSKEALKQILELVSGAMGEKLKSKKPSVVSVSVEKMSPVDKEESEDEEMEMCPECKESMDECSCEEESEEEVEPGDDSKLAALAKLKEKMKK
jgi:uncharacterized protein with PIN domain